MEQVLISEILDNAEVIILVEDRPETKRIIAETIAQSIPSINILEPGNWEGAMGDFENYETVGKNVLLLTDVSLVENGFEERPNIILENGIDNGFDLSNFVLKKYNFDRLVYSADPEQISEGKINKNGNDKPLSLDKLKSVIENHQIKHEIELFHGENISELIEAKASTFFAHIIMNSSDFGNLICNYKGGLLKKTIANEIRSSQTFLNITTNKMKTISFGVLSDSGKFEFSLDEKIDKSLSTIISLKEFEDLKMIYLKCYAIKESNKVRTNVRKKIKVETKKFKSQISLLELDDELQLEIELEYVFNIFKNLKRLALNESDKVELLRLLAESNLPVITQIRIGRIIKIEDEQALIENQLDLSSVIILNEERYRPYKNQSIELDDSFREIDFEYNGEKQAAQIARYELSYKERF